jgi:hypothetical protein
MVKPLTSWWACSPRRWQRIARELYVWRVEREWTRIETPQSVRVRRVGQARTVQPQPSSTAIEIHHMIRWAPSAGRVARRASRVVAALLRVRCRSRSGASVHTVGARPRAVPVWGAGELSRVGPCESGGGVRRGAWGWGGDMRSIVVERRIGSTSSRFGFSRGRARYTAMQWGIGNS